MIFSNYSSKKKNNTPKREPLKIFGKAVPLVEFRGVDIPKLFNSKRGKEVDGEMECRKRKVEEIPFGF